ncbi:SAM-dependent methyltransferase [Spongiactinospora sp. TRM90649]|uniref:SAM-dependent methyltransferase n=1 Tax=Spongiactinospora sp. TRM90649 TaxID=3031114 RepID=UPI0023F8559C|nr:SAM-dependent methyltransferase [Spongiactinospora sp. TRM90649]MDF5758095.1 SAM-dependent methyltransferase [Spongiactinospora sp. TRM90649]
MSDDLHEPSENRAKRQRVVEGIDHTKPSVARVYDYLLGGKDNYAVDQRVASMLLQLAPDAPEAARANRQFLGRVVRHLAVNAGITQFIDIGSGLPTRGNVHEIAQSVLPEARVIYIDNDPTVLAHGRALLAKTLGTAVVDCDLREPETLLHDSQATGLVDLSKPVGMLLFGILHHLNDHERPEVIAAGLRDALPSGSHFALSHFCNPGAAHPEVAEHARAAERVFNQRLGTGRWRSREEILAYFGDWELLSPGLVPLSEWRPAPSDDTRQSITYHDFVGGVARRP